MGCWKHPRADNKIHRGKGRTCAACGRPSGTAPSKHVLSLRAQVRAAMEGVFPEPPSIVTKEQLKFAGDVLGRNADAMKKKGARREDHYAQNQLAHWLWKLAGARRAP